MSEAYKQAGVDIVAGDAASRAAYQLAQTTFSARDGMIGAPADLPGGFAGALDFGDHYLIMNCDGVGTKVELAMQNEYYEELGKDLLAMVVDDAICLGAEVVSMTNTFDVERVDAAAIEAMMKGLATACREEKIIISGGEIAELGSLVRGILWNATAVGIVDKDKMITGAEIQPGDSIIALEEKGFRSNGFSLVRKILRDAGQEQSDLAKRCLRGSTLYHGKLLQLLGRKGEERKIGIKGLAHITGGGIPGNIRRILPKGMGANLTNLFAPGAEMQELRQMANLATKDLYTAWNGGNGMTLFCDPADEGKLLQSLSDLGLVAQKAGVVTDTPEVVVEAYDGEILRFPI